MNSTDDGLVIYDASGHLISPSYGYLPTRSVCYIFVFLFLAVTALHLAQSIRFRAWWLLPTMVLGATGEVIGWFGRLWSSYSPLDDNPYLMQIVCTIIAPTPFIGAVFITAGSLCVQLGPQYSRLSARLYSRIFLTVDFIALAIQSAGGGIAATVADEKLGDIGVHIMLAGIIFQLVSLVVFCALMAEYFYRYTRDMPIRPTMIADVSTYTEASDSPKVPAMDKSLKRLAAALGFVVLCLLIRGIYRVIELADGFHGRIITTEVYFNVLDGMMVVLAMYTFVFFHPVQLLQAAERSRSGMMSMRLESTVSV